MKIEGIVTYITEDGKSHKKEGEVSISNKIQVSSVDAEGDITFHALKCKSAKFEGDVSGNSIESENLTIHGEVKLDKVISKNANFYISQQSTIGEIDSEQLFIDTEENGNPEVFSVLFKKLFDVDINLDKNAPGATTISNINSKNINIKNCVCGKIQCDNAILRGNCIINELNYSTSLEKEDTVKINNIVKINK